MFLTVILEGGMWGCSQYTVSGNFRKSVDFPGSHSSLGVRICVSVGPEVRVGSLVAHTKKISRLQIYVGR